MGDARRIAGAAAHIGFGADTVGLFGLIGIVSIFGGPIIGRITDRLGTRFMIGAGAVTLLVAFGFVSQAERSLWALALLGIALIDIGYRSVLLANQTPDLSAAALGPEPAQHRVHDIGVSWAARRARSGGAAAVVWSWTGLALAGAGLAAAALVFHLLTSRAAVKERA